MRTYWNPGDIITSEKLNLLEENSLFNPILFLNDYQDENDKTIFHITDKEIIKHLNHENAFIILKALYGRWTYIFKQELYLFLNHIQIYDDYIQISWVQQKE